MPSARPALQTLFDQRLNVELRRYPMDDRAFDYLQQAEPEVQDMFLAEFQPKRRRDLRSGAEGIHFSAGFCRISSQSCPEVARMMTILLLSPAT